MKNLILFLVSLSLIFSAAKVWQNSNQSVVGVKITSVQNGNWNSASTWDVKVPTGQDTVVIDNNHVITLDGNCYLHYLKSNTGGEMIFTSTSNLIYQ